MAVNKGTSDKTKEQVSVARNATTGNLIARDPSSGLYFIVKEGADPKSITLQEVLPKYTGKGKVIVKKTSPKGLTTNKRKAAQAEKAVLSYLNDSKK